MDHQISSSIGTITLTTDAAGNVRARIPGVNTGSAITASATKPKRRRLLQPTVGRPITRHATNAVKPVKRAVEKPAELELLARQVEQSPMSVDEIAKRSNVDLDALGRFLVDDSEALSPEELDRVRVVITTSDEMSLMTKRQKSPSTPATRVDPNALYEKANTPALIALALLIAETSLNPRQIATRAGLDPARVFGFVTGLVSLTDDEVDRINRAIGNAEQVQTGQRKARDKARGR